MRGLRLIISGILVVLLCAACTTITESTPPAASDDVKAAQKYLDSTKESDGKVLDEVWERAIVLTTHYEDTTMNGRSWSMTALLASGSTSTFSDGFNADYDRLRGIAPGDFVAFQADGEYIDSSDIVIKKKAAVSITGK
jgi:hypothetical protein